MSTNVADILRRYRADHDLSQAAMAVLLGVGYRTYQEIEKTGRVSKVSVLETIMQKIAPGQSQKAAYEFDDDEPSVVREDPEPYFQQLQRKKLQPPEDGLIAVPIAAQANYITHYQDPVYINQLQRVVLPGLPYRGVRYRVFEVNGTSMEPTFREGYHVLCELVEPQDHTSIANYYVYVVVTETQVMLKRLYKLDDKRVVLISDNEEFYPQVAIRWDQIQELWLVKRKIDWEMAPPKRFEIKI